MISLTIKNELSKQKKTVLWLAEKMGFSIQYVYKLLDQDSNKRWNEDSINKACEALGLEIQFKNTKVR